jgi:uncharacterized protein
MRTISFEWDAQKADENWKKHRVSFAEGGSAFYDDSALVIDDPDGSDDEVRFLLLGMSRRLRVLVVCHCYRHDDEVIRIISARP